MKTIENFKNLKGDEYGWSLERDKQRIIKRSLDGNLGRATFNRHTQRQVKLIAYNNRLTSMDSR